MDTVVLDGVEYVKASVAAKRFHYTSDYIGQLCRAKKIDARLVGRTWFVNPDSIEGHKVDKVKKREERKAQAKQVSAVVTEDEEKPKKTFAERIKVSAPLKSKTARTLAVVEPTPAVAEVKLNVEYEQDKESLLPEIRNNTSTQSARIHVDHADAKSIKVRKQSGKQLKFTVEEMPSVALSGNIKVSGYDDPKEPETEMAPAEVLEEEVSPVIKPIKSLSVPKNAPKNKAKLPKKSAQTQVRANMFAENTAKSSETTANKASRTLKGTKPAPFKAQPSFSPQSVQTQISQPSFFFRFSPVFATTAAIVFVFGILAASSQVISSDAENTSKIIFQVANIQSLFGQ